MFSDNLMHDETMLHHCTTEQEEITSTKPYHSEKWLRRPTEQEEITLT